MVLRPLSRRRFGVLSFMQDIRKYVKRNERRQSAVLLVLRTERQRSALGEEHPEVVQLREFLERTTIAEARRALVRITFHLHELDQLWRETTVLHRKIRRVDRRREMHT